jgi:hypothetical protein
MAAAFNRIHPLTFSERSPRETSTFLGLRFSSEQEVFVENVLVVMVHSLLEGPVRVLGL